MRLPAPIDRASLWLTESTRDVVLSLFLGRICEQLTGLPNLDEAPGAEEGGDFADARRLLHIMRHDDDGVILFEFKDQIFRCEPSMRDRVPMPVRPSTGLLDLSPGHARYTIAVAVHPTRPSPSLSIDL